MKTIRKIDHDFRRPLSPRKYTDKVVFHHSAGNDVSAETIHQWHRDRKTANGGFWSGIGYHYVIRADGTIEEGRPIDMYGAHAGNGANGSSIGVCLTGHLDQDHPSEEQIQSAIWLTREVIFRQYGPLELTGHRDHMATSCPGKNFPFEEIEKAINGGLDRNVQSKSKYFKDIPLQWQADHVDYLKEKGILSGRSEELFDPDTPMTRAECAVVISKAIQYLMNHPKEG